ncbi:HNH endonuclease [Candidatus Saccharibacteria bacterium]|nr:HNH endonuclease [Candidatus Saccharibacteria bacterium]
MSKKYQPIKTTRREIADYWFAIVDDHGLSVNASEAHERCWRCGYGRRLQRCHIVPVSLGGKDEPANLVLLCKRCHEEGPNVTDVDIMWDWIRAYGAVPYDAFWAVEGAREYEFVYGRAYADELKDLGVSEDDMEEFRSFVGEVMKEKASVHFGQSYFNKATLAGIYRMALKEFTKK